MRREYHGGQNARDWRRKVAALARGQKESVFTYKFKLDVRDGDVDFDAAARAYDVTEGIARGSLRLGLRGAPVRVPAVFQSCGNAPIREPQPIPRSRLCRGAPCAHRNRKRRRDGPVHRKRLHHAPAKEWWGCAPVVGGRTCATPVPSLERPFTAGDPVRPSTIGRTRCASGLPPVRGRQGVPNMRNVPDRAGKTRRRRAQAHRHVRRFHGAGRGRERQDDGRTPAQPEGDVLAYERGFSGGTTTCGGDGRAHRLSAAGGFCAVT